MGRRTVTHRGGVGKTCRASDGDLYPWGSDVATATLANFKPDQQGSTSNDGIADVASDPPGVHGLYDMAGNTFEWTSSLDWNYPYDEDDGREDANATGNRVILGGSYALDRFDVRCSYRVEYVVDSEDARVDSIGCRVVSRKHVQ